MTLSPAASHFARNTCALQTRLLNAAKLFLPGALAEPADRALIVFRAADKSKVEAFARKDPYVMNGLVKKWEVRHWNVVVGNEQPASTRPLRR